MLACSTEDNINKEEDLEILDFSSPEDMGREIKNIIELKDGQEFTVYQKLLKRNNIFNNKSDSNKHFLLNEEIKYDKIKVDLIFYHRERLNYIHELRKEMGFTSLQSLVDEINSLRLLEPNKAEQMYQKNSDFLNKSKYKVSSKFGDLVSNVLNLQGKVKINDKIISMDNISDEYGKILYEDGEGGTGGGGSGGSSPSFFVGDSGFLHLTIGGNLAVEWSVGRMLDNENIFYNYAYFSKITGYVKTTGETYVPYPITINIGAPSFCRFKKHGTSGFSVDFRRAGTDVTFFNYQSRSRRFYLDEVRIQSGTFSLIYDGTEYSIVTPGFYRDYDNYNPNTYDKNLF
jgi:hypothetical protein